MEDGTTIAHPHAMKDDRSDREMRGPKHKDWEVRLAHWKAVRNAIALCNDVPLDSIIDPPGGMIELVPAQMMKFNGTKVKSYLASNGHDYSSLDECKCWCDHKRMP